MTWFHWFLVVIGIVFPSVVGLFTWWAICRHEHRQRMKFYMECQNGSGSHEKAPRFKESER